ncbi:MAG: IS200/IS605 family transposase [Bacteroidota bacterium]
MSGRFTQIYIHLVFAVKNRKALIHPYWDEKLYKYISGIVNAKGHKALAINGHWDHIHIFLGLNPTYALSDLVREIKKASSNWIKEEKLTSFKFEWQSGYGAFSHNHDQLETVITYIKNQKTHHRKKKFKEEYVQMLEKWVVEYDEKYIFGELK